MTTNIANAGGISCWKSCQLQLTCGIRGLGHPPGIAPLWASISDPDPVPQRQQGAQDADGRTANVRAVPGCIPAPRTQPWWTQDYTVGGGGEVGNGDADDQKGPNLSFHGPGGRSACLQPGAIDHFETQRESHQVEHVAQRVAFNLGHKLWASQWMPGRLRIVAILRT